MKALTFVQKYEQFIDGWCDKNLLSSLHQALSKSRSENGLLYDEIDLFHQQLQELRNEGVVHKGNEKKSQKIQKKIAQLEKQVEDVNLKIAEANLPYLDNLRSYNRQREIGTEVFLIENGEELCGIYYDDCDIDHNKEWNDSEFEEYIAFLKKTWADFFLKFQNVLREKKN